MKDKKNYIVFALIIIVAIGVLSFKKDTNEGGYEAFYYERLNQFKSAQSTLVACIEISNLQSETDVRKIKEQLQQARSGLKSVDFWWRYLEPIQYKKINGPLPVEWETEVFEKFEAPYKREGAGLTLAALYLDEGDVVKDSLLQLLNTSVQATETYLADSITKELNSYHHFFLCNRLYLLNLAAIYTTGFECPDTAQVIPELRLMLKNVDRLYEAYNQSFPKTALPENYLNLYKDAIHFVGQQPSTYSAFDHFNFIKTYINPLFLLNQKMIRQYHVVTKSLVDFSLNKKEITIFDKALYNGQNPKGIFLRVTDPEALQEMDRLGKLLFYDPILSSNNERSCASCHKPTEYFTDTATATSLQLNHQDFLPRNTPSLINAQYNHLLMLDGKHISLLNQTKDVITNPKEMGCGEEEVMEKILSCSEYKTAFKRLLKYTPQEKEIGFDHIASAITFYYSKYSQYYSPFDDAMNHNKTLSVSATKGFNLFMSKAQCATCHFVPQFNGVKPPYTNSEFEVLGVPHDTSFKNVGNDNGRFEINAATETANAFRTGTIRNASFTGPYMHNGVFASLGEVINFYDAGGGVGRGIAVANQTLSSDSLKLTAEEKAHLLQFILSLNEDIQFEPPPRTLPISKDKTLNNRKVGGEY